MPEEYDAWEKRLVPRRDLSLKGQYHGYESFYLSFDVTDIGDLLAPIPGQGTLPFDW